MFLTKHNWAQQPCAHGAGERLPAAARLRRRFGAAAPAAIIVAAAAFSALPAGAQVVTTWKGPTPPGTGGAGVWSDATKWSNGVPDAASADVQIDGGKATNSTVTLDGSRTVGRLTADAGDGLVISNNTSLFLTSAGAFAGAGTLADNGTVTLQSTGNYTQIVLATSATLNGTGTVNLTANTPGNEYTVRLLGNAGTERLTVASGATVAGQGVVGVGQMLMTNNGTVNANINGGTLTMQPSGGGGDFTNNGTWEATSGGALTLLGGGGAFNNNAAITAAGAGSQVMLVSNPVVIGGSFNTSAGGVVHNASSATLTNVTSNGTFNADNNTNTTLAGTFTNNGTVTLTSTGNYTQVVLASDTSLNGNGTIRLTASAPSNDYTVRVLGATGAERLTVASSQTIAGEGLIGFGQMRMTNNGTINANIAGTTLTLQPAGSGGDFTNNVGGVWEASNGGALVLLGGGGTFANAGTLQALNASEVRLVGNPSLTGTLSTVGTGVVHNASSATLTNVTSNGTFNADNNTNTTLAGTFTNNGTVTLAGTGNYTQVLLSGNVTLAGTGALNLTANVPGLEPTIRVMGTAGNERLTIASGATVAGQGLVGNAQMLMTNNGTVNANISGGTITLQPTTGGDFTNAPSGVWEASNGGVLILAGGGGSFASTGTLQALNGSEVRLSANPTLSGTLTTAGTGFIHNTTGAALTNVTNNGAFKADNNTNTTLAGTFTNNGTVTLTTTGNYTQVVLNGSVTLAGTGTVTLAANAPGSDSTVRLLGTTGADRLTIAGGATIAGRGIIGFGQMLLTNNGTVNANISGATLTMQPTAGGDFTNNATGTWEASNGGVLILAGGGGSFASTGTLLALNGSEVRLATNPALSGTFSTAGTGFIHNTSGATLTNVTSNGTFNADNNTNTTLAGTFTNNGTVTLAGTGNYTQVLLSGNVTLAGTGALNLTANVPGLEPTIRVMGTAGNERLTIASGATVAGQGLVGNAQMLMTNNGTVNANISGGTITLQPTTGGDFTNAPTGVWAASNGGTLHFAAGGGTFTNNGTIQANDGSAAGFDAGAVLTNNAGGTLTGGTYKAITATAAAATINLSGGNVTTNAANVVLSGANASIPAINTLTANAVPGQFHILAGKSFTTVGPLTNAGIVEVGNTASVTMGGTASYTQTAGTTIVDGTLAVTSPGVAHVGGGVLRGTGTVSGVLANDPGGDVAPGDSPGTLHVTGNYNQANGATLDIELAGLAPGLNYDVLSITGTASLGGTLKVTLLNSFSPAYGSSFTILTAADSRVGTFATTSLPAFADFRQWQVNYNPNNVTLSVVPEPTSVGVLALAAGGLLGRRRGRAGRSCARGAAARR